MDWTAWNATAERIGWIAMESARVEVALATLEMSLIGNDRAAPVIFGQGWAANRDGCIALLRDRVLDATHDPSDRRHLVPVYERMIALVRRVDAAMTERAHVIHALWGPTGYTDQESVQIKRWGKQRVGSWTPEALGQIRRDLAAGTRELYDAVRQFDESGE